MKYKILLCLLLLSFYSFSQVSLVYDVNVGASSSNPTQLKKIPSNLISGSPLEGLIFSATNGTSGLEPFIYHNEQSGSIADINPGVGGSFPESFTFYKNEFYFTANNPNSGKEPWKGLTTATLFKDIRTGNLNSTPLHYFVFNNDLYFSAFQDATGRELWKSDGTFNGTTLVKDINTKVSGGNTTSSNPENFTISNGQLFFTAKSDLSSVEGIELYVTDGTVNGTTLVRDLNSNGDSSPIHLTDFNNKLYFSANNGANGRELWISDGTFNGTQLVDISSGASSSSPRDFTEFNNKLFFVATHGSLGEELYSIDTNNNFELIKDINSNALDGSPNNLIVFNNKLYFTANDGANGVELWSSEGTTTTTNLLKDINSNGSSNPSDFTIYKNKLYFNADDGIHGKELWVTDGTSNGTVMVKDINTSGDGDPQELVVVNNDLFFVADNGTSGREIFKYTDPTLHIEKKEVVSFKLYPNPANNYFTIETKNNYQRIHLLDLSGKMVKSYTSEEQIFRTDNINSGVYIVKIIHDKVNSYQKLIIQ